MFTKDDHEEAVKLGGQHIFDEKLHADMFFDTIVDAENAADAGITEEVVMRPAFWDKDGNERELPKKSDDDNARGKGRQGKGRGARRQPYQQSRTYHRFKSRGSRRSRSRSRARDGGVRAGSWRAGSSSLVPIGAHTSNAPSGSASANEVKISGEDLEELLGGLRRAITAADFCANWCKAFSGDAASKFENGRNALQASRETLERNRHPRR